MNPFQHGIIGKISCNNQLLMWSISHRQVINNSASNIYENPSTNFDENHECSQEVSVGENETNVDLNR